MSAKGIQEVLSRAMTDTAFAKSLFTDTENALKGYDLTAGEIAEFRELSHTEIESMDAEDRKSLDGGFWLTRAKTMGDHASLNGFNLVNNE